jgi:dTDP-4-dehydrorhamnose 3,5-epimerase
MIITQTPLAGARILEIERHVDERGFFARTFCARELEKAGLETAIAQSSLAYNHKRGTLRGMHWQADPAAEVKLIRCTRGAVWDVIIDLRPESATYGRHLGVELSAESRRTLYVPKGFANGYQTLTDDAELAYQLSAFYTPSAQRGLRYDDPAFAIEWPLPVSVISERDRGWPLYVLEEKTAR